MNTRLLSALACLALLFAIPALAQDKAEVKGTAVEPTPSGTVSLSLGQGGFILSASGGQGVLTFKGKKYPFRIGGMGIGGIGVNTAKAQGQVYHLENLSDFPGTFVEFRAGYAAGEGTGTLWLKNTNGVVLKLKTVTKGLSLNLGGDGMRVEMGEIKKKK